MSRLHDTQNSINDRIALETKTLHERNNKVASLKMVLALRSAELWREYVRTFYWLFLTFERAVEDVKESGPEHLRAAFDAVHEPLLLRTNKIEQDLMFYYHQDESVLKTPASTEVREYMTHVQCIAKEDPVKLMAYLSVMYLGLFAGGQIIKAKIVKRTGFYPAKAGLSHAQVMDHGLNIFKFDSDDTSELKQTHRARFDRVCLEYLSQSEKDKIVEEAKEIFVRNERLIANVDVPNTFLLVLQTFHRPLTILLLILMLLYFVLLR